jgi:hypothetical protein
MYVPDCIVLFVSMYLPALFSGYLLVLGGKIVCMDTPERNVRIRYKKCAQFPVVRNYGLSACFVHLGWDVSLSGLRLTLCIDIASPICPQLLPVRHHISSILSSIVSLTSGGSHGTRTDR